MPNDTRFPFGTRNIENLILVELCFDIASTFFTFGRNSKLGLKQT